jgi:ribulose-phosphate 3-epimerase
MPDPQYPVEILPSILAADFAHLGDQVRAVESAGISMLHVDVMDGHFVPNITLGPPVVESLRKVTQLKLDCHLMISDPDKFAPAFAKAGADLISVHQEACPHLDRTLHMIKDLGVKAGVVLNPATPVATLDEVLHLADYILIMSVNPGFGGQKFILNSLRKIAQLARLRSERGLHYAIEIDGGVTAQNAAEIARAGCDWFVAGSSVFHSVNPGHSVVEIRQAAVSASSVLI